MQTRSSDDITICPTVCPSVRPSVKRADCDKTEKGLSRFLYHMKDHLACDANLDIFYSFT